jgi:uncharacterized iron-regulated membrane protein
MRLSRRAFLALWDVHAWVGITAGLLMCVVCFTGAFCVYFDELGIWQEASLRDAPAPSTRSLSDAVDPVLKSGRIDTAIVDVFLPDEARPMVEIRHRRGVSRERLYVHPVSGEVIEERSRLAVILFYLHFFYHERFFPQGTLLTGALGVAMLLGLVTGLVLHFRNLASQLHQFRPQHPRAGWPDAHKVFAVFGLPFQVMAAFTGVMICFGPVMLRLAVGPVFHGDMTAAQKSLYGSFAGARPTQKSAPMLGTEELVQRAKSAVPGMEPTALRIHAYGDAAGTITVYGKHASSAAAPASVRLRLTDGSVVFTEMPDAMRPGQTLERWMRALHFVELGGGAVKAISAFSALAACLTILTGNWLWILRRRSQGRLRGTRFMGSLTLSIGGGLCTATAALFLTNVCAPGARAESVAFFASWALALVWSFVRGGTRRAWAEMLGTAGALFVLVSLLDAVIRRACTIDLALLAFGAVLLCIARRVAPAWETRGGALRHA